MSTDTLDIYNLLIKAGIDREVAEPLAKEIVTREDAKAFATKSDVSELKTEIANAKSTTIMWMAGFHVASVGLIVTLLSI